MPAQLDALFDPGSVAVIGASATPGKWGHELARLVLEGQERRRVYLVNRNGGEILGQPVYRSPAELPEAPEAALVVVPERSFEEAVDGALERGARVVVGLTSGFGELGEEGRRRELAIAERVRRAGATLLGPNCIGVYDAAARFNAVPFLELSPGNIALISQSGGLAEEIAHYLREYGLGYSRFVSIGNQVDVTVTALVRACARHPETRLIVLYVEDFQDGREVFAAVHEARSSGCPVVVLHVPASEPVQRAARSHTGSLASEAGIIEMACRAAGAVPVSTPRGVAEAAHALLSPTRGRGRRIGLLGDTGGFVVVGAGAATAEGLEIPTFSEELRARLAAEASPLASCDNPVDLVVAAPSAHWVTMAGPVLASDEVDALFLVGGFGMYVGFGIEDDAQAVDAATRIAELARAAEKPLVVATPTPTSSATATLRSLGVPVYRDLESGARALRHLCEHPGAPGGVPRLPPALASPGGDEASYFGSRALLASYGIAFPEAVEVRELEEALGAAARLGFPVALKALGLLHKSDAGGVVLGLRDEDELARAFTELESRLAPPAYSLERMVTADGGVELIVGARRDARFGPVLVVGMGGLFTEILRDTQVLFAPADAAAAERALRDLRGASLLLGARGRAQLDLAAAAAAAAALSRLAAERPDLADVEVNPLLVLRDGAVALDSRVIRTAGEAEEVAHELA